MASPSNTTHPTIRSDIQQHLAGGLDAADLKFLDAWPWDLPRKVPETFNGIAIE